MPNIKNPIPCVKLAFIEARLYLCDWPLSGLVAAGEWANKMKLIANYYEQIPFKEAKLVKVEVMHVAGIWAMVRKEKFAPFVVAKKKLSDFKIER